MQYTAIIKDGGLFIPNVFSDLDDDRTHVVQVTVDMASVRQQLGSDAAPKDSVKAAKKPVKKTARKAPAVPPMAEVADADTLRDRAISELDALDDSELSEMLKAYINDGQGSAQIALDNL
ncbi:hypothetical protein [Psychrobacter aestuarii]|uniref:Uncharacterized protein n=1 Tax=Psychrobacter aestuarii TaxID=556327 RepID=A0ABP3FM50_9GAMM|nr:hypothetical protein [Psychrobacter aestuarii]